MKTTEIRVKPVVRHIVTRYTEGGPEGEGENRALLETLGEFANEGYAEQVAEALRHRVASREYVIVARSGGEVAHNDLNREVLYAYSAEEAEQRSRKFSENGVDFKIFSRERDMKVPG